MPVARALRPRRNFRIELPMVTAQPAALGALAPRGPALVPNRGLALIVDDEPDLARALGRLIEREGHQVDVAPGRTAKRTCMLDRDSDNVLSHLRMPDADGPALHRSIIGERPHFESGWPS